MLYFDDIEVGYQSEVGTYTLTESEVIEFASTWDPQPFHIDKDAASASIFGGLTASSLHLFAICTRLFFDHEDRIQILAMLGKEAIRIPNPARPGDVLTYSTECIRKKPSSSRPDRGVITLKDTLTNQDGQPVLTQEVALLVARQNDLSE
ncbi:MAG: MaoC/PaaZ C-terminal domain-containing protein [Gammaproteobacteria bacterium]|nr:MaoC/PaaZ C-terminal domain-containing protein [Gammaproteobacteria bacterium]